MSAGDGSAGDGSAGNRASGRPAWPDDLQPYRSTPEFDETSIPAGLLRAHTTRQGTWARLHVRSGALRFRDLVSDETLRLGPGVHPLIHPERLHEVAVIGPVRFVVEFCSRPVTDGT